MTGFGLLGHAQYLAQVQEQSVHFDIHTLPIIKYCKDMEGKARHFKLFEGRSAETSGGLLCSVSEEHVEDVLKESGGVVIGQVERGNKDASIRSDFEVIEME